MLARPEPVDDGSASSESKRQSTKASLTCTLRKADAKGDCCMSEDDKDECDEFPEFFGGELANFHDFRTGFVKFLRKRITATGIASDNIFKKSDAAWPKSESEKHGRSQRMRVRGEATSASQRQGCGSVSAFQDLRVEGPGQHLQAMFGC